MDAKSILQSLQSAYDTSDEIKSTVDKDMSVVLSMGLLHNKSDLEQLLARSVLVLENFDRKGNRNYILCSSNNALIKVFSLEKENDQKKAAKLKSTGIKCKQMDRVKTWNFIDNSLNDFILNTWSIKLAILLLPDPNNIMIVSKILKAVLKG